MALSRSFLKGMGLTDEQVSAIVEAHAESIDALKEQRDSYKADADKLKDVEKELNDLKASGGDWEEKYNTLNNEYTKYKTEQETKTSRAAKTDKYKALLKDIGVNEKRFDAILRTTKIDELELDKKGELKDRESLAESAKTEWADFISTSGTEGAHVETPPSGSTGASGVKMSKADIMKIRDTAKRQKAISENMALFE